MSQNTKTLVFFSISLLTLGFVLVLLGIGLAWLKPTTAFAINGHIAIEEKTYHTGDLLSYSMNYCKNSPVEAEVHYSFIDSLVYSTPGMTTHELPLGCHTVKEAIVVPNLPSGVYSLEMVRVYYVTPLQRIEVRDTSGKFAVIGR